MKKYIVLGLLILVIGSMVIVPMLQNDDDSEIVPATFLFKDNLATKWKEVVPLRFKIQSDEIEKLELLYNDSVLKSWKNLRTVPARERWLGEGGMTTW